MCGLPLPCFRAPIGAIPAKCPLEHAFRPEILQQANGGVPEERMSIGRLPWVPYSVIVSLILLAV